MTVQGHVRNGVIVLDTPTVLPEGAAVMVRVVPPKSQTMSPTKDRPILRHAGTLKLGPNASREVDDVLYGSNNT